MKSKFTNGSECDQSSACTNDETKRKLLPDELRQTLPRPWSEESYECYSQEGNTNPIVRLKFIAPSSGWVMYVSEGQSEGNGDFRLYGFELGNTNEWVSYLLSELENCPGQYEPAIERDTHFQPMLLSEALKKNLNATSSMPVVEPPHNPHTESAQVKLLTEELKRKLPKLYEQENVEDKIVYAKFFTPDSSWSWFVTEGQEDEGDFRFFGFVKGFEGEWGYFMLSELESARGPLGLSIERDTSFDATPFSEVRKTEGL